MASLDEKLQVQPVVDIQGHLFHRSFLCGQLVYADEFGEEQPLSLRAFVKHPSRATLYSHMNRDLLAKVVQAFNRRVAININNPFSAPLRSLPQKVSNIHKYLTYIKTFNT
jgi:hypothetical protein